MMPEAVPEVRDAFKVAVQQAESLLQLGHKAAREWLSALQSKAQNPGNSPPLGTSLLAQGWDSSLAQAVQAVNDGIAKHNASVDNFEVEKAEAASKLKRHFLHESLPTFHDLTAKETEAKTALDEIDGKLAHIRAEIQSTRSQLKAHGPAAKQLNRLLKSYLGHDKITLAPTDEGYEICRDGKPSTKPLSEGEKTGIAFCYFITSLTAEGRKIEDMIVVVDDAISSLDTRAMSYVVGMIRLRFANCAQFFVLTHNLDFMREMKKWLNAKRRNGEAAFLFIETRIQDNETRSSTIVEMPALIREYESEYHYLFSLVCKLVADPAAAGGFLYLMPNAMRKVLETFLAFKQPGFADLQGLDKILELCPDLDAECVKAMELLIQAESHSQNIGDSVSFSGYTLEQIKEAGKTLLGVIETADKPHFDRMKKLCNA
jgi:wobble nucleotide-excising tRNase